MWPIRIQTQKKKRKRNVSQLFLDTLCTTHYLTQYATRQLTYPVSTAQSLGKQRTSELCWARKGQRLPRQLERLTAQQPLGAPYWYMQNVSRHFNEPGTRSSRFRLHAHLLSGQDTNNQCSQSTRLLYVPQQKKIWTSQLLELHIVERLEHSVTASGRHSFRVLR